jgi:hypothetical protein
MLALACFVAAFMAWPCRAECPADSSSWLPGQSRRALRELALQASASPEPLCHARGLALFDWLDRAGLSSCAASSRSQSLEQGDPMLLAFDAAQAWRCGRAREAHALALEALRHDSSQPAAWHTLAAIFHARWNEPAAQAAYERALALDPDDPEALFGLADLVDRHRSRALLQQYLAIASQRGEPYQRVRNAIESVAHLDALGDRRLFVVERETLPSTIPFTVWTERAGQRRALVIEVQLATLRRVPALFDTGASGLFLSPTIEKRIGFSPLSDSTLVGGGGSGEHEVRQGVIATLDLGAVTFRDALGTMSARSLHPQGLYRAIVGANLLGGTRLRLRKAASPIEVDKATPLPACPEPLSCDPWPEDSAELPILRVEGQLLVPVTLQGSRGEVASWMVFDTGASTTILDSSIAEWIGEPRYGSAGQANAFGGTLDFSGRLRGVQLRIGAWSQTLPDQATVDLSARARISGITVAGFLGLDVISSASFELDLARGTLRVER